MQLSSLLRLGSFVRVLPTRALAPEKPGSRFGVRFVGPALALERLRWAGLFVALVLLGASPVPSVASGVAVERALEDTTFAGDWGHGGVLLATWPGATQAGGFVANAGGIYGLWSTSVGATPRARVTRWTFDGVVADGWSSEGVFACDDSAGQADAQIVSDGAEGVFVAWRDSRDSLRLYVQHLLPNGSPAPGWPSAGMRIIEGAPPTLFRMVPDFAGGAFLAWENGRRSWDSSVLLTRMVSDGSTAQGWPATGLVVQQGDVSQFPSFSISYELTVLAPGVGGSAWVGFDAKPTCSGHCGANSYNAVFNVDSTGMRFQVSTSPDVSFRKTIGDGRGGVFTYFKWASDVVFEHYGGAAQYDDHWFAFAPVGLEPLADPAGFGYLQSGFSLRRYRPDGTPDPGWGGPSGAQPVGSPALAYGPQAVSDGAGGLALVWMDDRARPGELTPDLYGAFVNADGSVEAGWTPTGLPIATGLVGTRYLWTLPAGAHRAVVVWENATPDGLEVRAQQISASQPVPVTLSLLDASATTGGVHLAWQAATRTGAVFTLERSDDASSWRPLATLRPDGLGRLEYVDVTAVPGERYGYRVALAGRSFPEVWVTPSTAAPSSELRIAQNPARDAIHLELSLPAGQRGQIEIFDTSGRRMCAREVAAAEPGVRGMSIGSGLSPGLYLVRLVWPGTTRAARAVIVR